jgi:hypothetical protein
MAIEQPTKEFLGFLQQHPEIRMQIRATPNKTLLYAGSFWPTIGRDSKPVWKELLDWKRSNPVLADKETLPDILMRILIHGRPFANLLDWTKQLDPLQPWKENGFLVWRALSGIFAANAVGKVSFYIGSGVTKGEKVFAATELGVLAKNPNVDSVTKDMLAYYQRCINNKQADINAGFIAS